MLDDCFAAAVISKLSEKDVDIEQADDAEADSAKMLQTTENIV